MINKTMDNFLLCLDNSPDSTAGIDIAIEMALAGSATLTGLHVYAARLHNERFRQMEGGLPAEYQNEKELLRQREIHDSLITRGLEIISDSYMTALHARAATTGLTSEGLSREGKNYEEIVKEADSDGVSLVFLGALGLGKSKRSLVGSVCERVVRRLNTDALIVKEGLIEAGAGVVAAVDGSPRSYGALKSAIRLAKAFNSPLDIISVYDPDFHHSAFRSIAGVLTEEASRLFRFEEQKKLHNNIIDRGLARIYNSHLESAVLMAGDLGMRARATLLSGKPFEEISRFVDRKKPRFLCLGKTGVHANDGLDIGSVTENCLRICPANIFISAEHVKVPPQKKSGDTPPSWTDEAEAKLRPIPEFARDAARAMIIEAAIDAGVPVITAEFMDRLKKGLDL